MFPEVVGEVDYIHPYGKGFMIYTDKEWSRGILKLKENTLEVFDGEYIKIPLNFVLSVDKSIMLPAIREGRALLLVEYLDVKSRGNVYLLVSAQENFIRKVRFELLRRMVSRVRIMYRANDKWHPGFVVVEADSISFSGPGKVSVPVAKILRVERKKLDYGLRKIGVISVEYQDGGENKSIAIFVNPMKRMFFWQLFNQVLDDYINSQILRDMSNLERMVLHLVGKEWSYEDIMAKLELTTEEMNSIVDKLERYGVIKKIVILKITDKGSKVLRNISEEDLRLP